MGGKVFGICTQDSALCDKTKVIEYRKIVNIEKSSWKLNFEIISDPKSELSRLYNFSVVTTETRESHISGLMYQPAIYVIKPIQNNRFEYMYTWKYDGYEKKRSYNLSFI